MDEFENTKQSEEITEASAVENNEVVENQTEENEENSSVLSDILEIIESVVISVFVVLLFFTYIARPVTVEGGSMNPTLEDSDKLIMRTICYTPKHGDIVIVNNENSYTYKTGTEEIVKGVGLQKRLIKRVIATGGQTVDIDFNTGAVMIDGKQLEEDYIKDFTKYDAKAFDYPVKVPEGYIFVMGDNRNGSTDSRDSRVGFVKEEDVLGEAVMRFYPFNDFKLLD